MHVKVERLIRSTIALPMKDSRGCLRARSASEQSGTLARCGVLEELVDAQEQQEADYAAGYDQ